jgi:UDPglucose 6-dehydrogenase
VNERQRKRVLTKLQQELHTLKGKRVALLGLAFKPNTDDLRGAPSLEIGRLLIALGARVVGYDPVAGKAARELVPEMRVVFDPYEALKEAHAAVVTTEWDELRGLDLGLTASLMSEPSLLVDGRNALNPASVRAAGLRYRGFGRG